MKVRFREQLNTKLFVYPVLFLLVVFLAGGIAFYYFSPLHFLKDFYKLHLANLSSEKKSAVDAWFEQYKKHIGYLSKNQTIRDNLIVLSTPPVSARKHDMKMIGLVSREARERVSQLLGEMALSSNSRMIALLSKEGRVIASSKKELAGEEWADRPFVKDALSEPKSGMVIGFYNDGTPESGIIGISPVSDSDDETRAFIYSVPGIDKLSDILRIESSFYNTEKVELLDRDGNLLVTKSGFPAKKLRYNIPKGYKENSVMLRDDLFFYVLSLDNAPFRLISVVEKREVMRPFLMLVIVFGSFAGLMILVLLFQSAYRAPRLITRPVSRLINAMKSVVSGNFDADWGKGQVGELLCLKEACEDMAREWRARESRLKGEAGPEMRKPGDERAVAEEFDMNELLQEIEEKARALIGTKEIELVVDSSGQPGGFHAYTDRLRLKQLLENLVEQAVRSTEAGTITLLLSEVVREGIRNIEASIADTGRGIEQEEGSGNPGLVMAKRLAEALGATLEIESEKGKGSVFTVTVPMKALLY